MLGRMSRLPVSSAWLYVLGVICVLCLRPVEAKDCRRLMPGLDKMGHGVDITTLDLTPISQSTERSSRKLPVLHFSCNKNLKWNARDGTEYDQPDQVWRVTSDPSGKMTSTTKLYKSYDDVRESMSNNVGVGAAYKLFAFSASASYASLQETITNTSRYVSELTYFSSAREVFLNLGNDVRLDRNAKSILMKPGGLGDYSTNPGPYREFIKLFGTHYFTQGKFGGYIRKVYETEMSYFYTRSDRQIEAEAQASFGPFFSMNGGHSSSSSKQKSTFEKNSEEHLVYYGGNTNLLSKQQGIQVWQPTVDKDPWLFSGQLKPLSELVRWDTQTRAGLEAATQQHVMTAYLGEARRLLTTARARLRSSSKQLTALSGRLMALSSQEILNRDDVLKLQHDLTPPTWFSKGTEFCLKWESASGTGQGQCGDGGSGNQLCAKPNDMTAPYKDDTHGHTVGCRMRWGIVSHGFEPWFQGVKICFMWNPLGDPSQCGGGIKRKVCETVKDFTKTLRAYMDKTDQRMKGCGMKWMLEIPNDAPLWLHTTQLCLAEAPEPGADARQCNMGRAGPLCAPANHWTEAYVDDTDNRRGGCLMRWGLMRLL